MRQALFFVFSGILMLATSQTTYTARAEALALAYANIGSNLPISTGQGQQGAFNQKSSQPSSGLQIANSASSSIQIGSPGFPSNSGSSGNTKLGAFATVSSTPIQTSYQQPIRQLEPLIVEFPQNSNPLPNLADSSAVIPVSQGVLTQTKIDVNVTTDLNAGRTTSGNNANTNNLQAQSIVYPPQTPAHLTVTPILQRPSSQGVKLGAFSSITSQSPVITSKAKAFALISN